MKPSLVLIFITTLHSRIWEPEGRTMELGSAVYDASVLVAKNLSAVKSMTCAIASLKSLCPIRSLGNVNRRSPRH
jgi:hypothetical protein